MTRQRNDELAFGSDSFLDVVANIVGILIILIVVAGVRVSQAPQPATQTDVVAETTVGPALPVLSEESSEPMTVAADPLAESPIFVLVTPEEPVISAPEPEVFPALPEVNIPASIAKTVENLSLQSQRLTDEIDQAGIAVERLQLRKTLTAADAAQLRKELEQTSTELEVDKRALLASTQVAIQNEQTVALLRQQVGEAAQVKPAKETLQHQLPPVGRLVTGREVHFRLIDGTISRVPIDELAERMQRDIERRKDVIMARRMFRGTAGPLDGYEMNYVIQRQSMSLFEEAQYGHAVVRMEITGWVMQPTPSLVSETYEEAIRPNSRFRNALLRAGGAATITFWVYPDSFELHQNLKTYLYESGFWVATRPLPAGVPIAGSPSGSQSFAQ